MKNFGDIVSECVWVRAYVALLAHHTAVGVRIRGRVRARVALLAHDAAVLRALEGEGPAGTAHATLLKGGEGGKGGWGSQAQHATLWAGEGGGRGRVHTCRRSTPHCARGWLRPPACIQYVY